MHVFSGVLTIFSALALPTVSGCSKVPQREYGVPIEPAVTDSTTTGWTEDTDYVTVDKGPAGEDLETSSDRTE